jgi:hypothetical protein
MPVSIMYWRRRKEVEEEREGRLERRECGEEGVWRGERVER